MDNNITLKYSLSRGQLYLLRVMMSIRVIAVLSIVSAVTALLWGLTYFTPDISPYFAGLADFSPAIMNITFIALGLLGLYVFYVFAIGGLRIAFESWRSAKIFGPRVIGIGEVRAAIMFSDKSKKSIELKFLVEHYEDKRYLVYKHDTELFIIDKTAISEEDLAEFYKRLAIVRQAAAQNK